MLLGSGYLGDFIGDPFAFVTRTVAGKNTSSEVRFYFTDLGLLPTGAKLFGYANGLLLTRNLVNGAPHVYSSSDDHFYSPAVAPGLDDGVYNPCFGFSWAHYEVAMSFSSIDKLSVLRVSWSANAPRTLEAEHHVKFDSAHALAEGTVVIFDDADLGRVFYGKIVEVDRNYKNGESIRYRCSDHYRQLVKSPARRDFEDEVPQPSVSYKPGVTGLRWDKGDSIVQAIRKLIEPFKKDIVPLGVSPHATQMPDSLLLMKALDKVGQSVAQWIDELLDQTEGGIAYIDPVTRSLRLRDYYQEPDITLAVGSYNVVTPSASNPLIVEGNVKSTTNGKFERVVINGIGKFQRRVDVGISPVYFTPVEVSPDSWDCRVRMFFPHTNVVGFYFDHNDEIQSAIYIAGDQQIGVTPLPPFEIVIGEDDLKRLNDPMDPNDGKLYHDYVFNTSNVGPPAFVVSNLKLRFTSYDGPLEVSAAATDPRLKGEGEYLIQRPDLYYFTSPGYIAPPSTLMEVVKLGSSAIDPTAEMQAQADLLKKRYSTRPDVAGKIAVHIKELTGSINIGSRVTNFDARVQSIEIDNAKRDLVLDFSDVPIRREAQEQKDAAVLKSETTRQLNLNRRVGLNDVAPLEAQAFNKRAQRWPPHDPCDCECCS